MSKFIKLPHKNGNIRINVDAIKSYETISKKEITNPSKTYPVTLISYIDTTTLELNIAIEDVDVAIQKLDTTNQ